MEHNKVRLSKQGEEFLHSPNCSATVRAVLRSIDTFSAEILAVEDVLFRLKLSECSLREDFISQNNFSVHKDHLKVI